MAAHRYWQAASLEAYSSTGLGLSEFQLLAGTSRVDTAATLTSNIAPATGSLANLQDDSTATSAIWTSSQLKTLVLTWDFGVTAGSWPDVTDMRLGSSADAGKFLLNMRLQYADVLGTWTDYVWGGAVPGLAGITWPGPMTKTVSVPRGGWSRTDKASGFNISVAGDSSVITMANPSGIGTARARTPSPGGVRQFEVVIGGSASAYVGVATADALLSPVSSASAFIWSYKGGAGTRHNNNTAVAYGGTAALGVVIGVVLDDSTGSLTFYKNGVSQGVAFSGVPAGVFPMAGPDTSQPVTATLKTSSFTYPVAGALPWDDAQIITTGWRSRALQVSKVNTPMSVVVPYGRTRGMPLGRGRGDFSAGYLGKGIGRVRGTIKVTPSTPVYRRVRLVRMRDGLQISEVWSNPTTGAYDFQYVDELQSYIVQSFDHTAVYGAVIVDRAVVELMP